MNAFFSSLSFTNRQWNDVVFENKNKAYGAYYIRTHYNENVGKAFGFTTLALTGLFVSFFIYNYFSTSAVAKTFHPSKTDSVVVVPRILIDDPPKGEIKPAVSNSHPPKITTDSIYTQSVDTTSVTPPVSSNGTASSLNQPTGSGSQTGGVSGQGTTVAPFVPDTAVKIVVDHMPEFPGGEDALDNYILKHITIPRQWKDDGEEGKIYFGFVVGMDGSVRDIKILSDKVGYGCAEANTDLFLKMPNWKPGKQHGYPVNVRMQVPLIFRKQ